MIRRIPPVQQKISWPTGQSTNDSYPTSAKLACILMHSELLLGFPRQCVHALLLSDSITQQSHKNEVFKTRKVEIMLSWDLKEGILHRSFNLFPKKIIQVIRSWETHNNQLPWLYIWPLFVSAQKNSRNPPSTINQLGILQPFRGFVLVLRLNAIKSLSLSGCWFNGGGSGEKPRRHNGNGNTTWVSRSETLDMGVSKNRGTPKWMVYNGKPY